MRRALLAATALILAAGVAVAAPVEQPAHYDVKAHITPSRRVSSVVHITLPASEVGHQVVFALGDRFQLSRVDGGPDAQISYGALEKPLPHLQQVTFDFKQAPDHPVTFTFAYAGPLADPLEKDSDRARKDFMELGLETAWFPFDPTLRLQFTSDADISGIAPNMVVVAQGQVRHVGSDVKLHRPTTDFDIPIIAATGLKRATAPDFEIYARDLNDPFARIYRKNAKPAFDYYRKLYGPLTAPTPIRMVEAPRGGGGYERRSFISTGDGKADLKADPHFPEYGPARHIAHEIAHGWWWNAVGQSDDYWMVESMAEFSALRYVREAYGEAAFKDLLDRKRDSAAKAGPVLTGNKKKPNSAVLYNKGPVLLYGLEDRIGRAKMDEFLGVIGRNPPQTTVEFLKALSDVAGPEVAKDFEARLRA
ncbi:MAG TPA: M1 family aminopeptidase [Caulobacteraceae bacterium]|jgi:hypothetical protein